jgi:hypothetical protein
LENTAAGQESNARLARSLYESYIKALEAQVEISSSTHRQALQGLVEQIRQHREALLELSRESLNAYDGFLDSLSSYWEEISKESASHTSQQVTASSEKSMDAVQLLDEWLVDESGYDEETWPQLKAALERDRLSYRNRFVD